MQTGHPQKKELNPVTLVSRAPAGGGTYLETRDQTRACKLCLCVPSLFLLLGSAKTSAAKKIFQSSIVKSQLVFKFSRNFPLCNPSRSYLMLQQAGHVEELIEVREILGISFLRALHGTTWQSCNINWSALHSDLLHSSSEFMKFLSSRKLQQVQTPLAKKDLMMGCKAAGLTWDSGKDVS